ncbi:MAG: hypothetical protein HY766_10275 [candidate division NC10 bacterium]|nr:hypothetical protein [candidate division NC10 bacterium]MBI4839829.1 hypothetical protein [candidate division NC10 bacterium]
MEYLEVVTGLRDSIPFFAGVVLVAAMAGHVWLGWTYEEILSRLRASMEEKGREPLKKAA